MTTQNTPDQHDNVTQLRHEALVEATVTVWEGGHSRSTLDVLANEVPIELSFQGVPHVVMLATPRDLRQLAIGFSVTEGLVKSPAEIKDVLVVAKSESIAVNISVSAERFSEILARQRHMSGRTGCGLCGSVSLEDAIRHPEINVSQMTIEPQWVQNALNQFSQHQRLNQRTGSIHAAAWVDGAQGISQVFEDVGRHNALDKLIGSLLEGQVDRAAGFVLLSSRASFELIQKSAMVGIGTVVAVSAPTALAVKTARHLGVTLVGFARTNRQVVYTNPHRILGAVHEA